VDSPQAQEVREALASTLLCGRVGLALSPGVKSLRETQKTVSWLAHSERESTVSPYTVIIGRCTAHLQCRYARRREIGRAISMPNDCTCFRRVYMQKCRYVSILQGFLRTRSNRLGNIKVQSSWCSGTAATLRSLFANVVLYTEYLVFMFRTQDVSSSIGTNQLINPQLLL